MTAAEPPNEHGKAIADFSEAIRLKPASAPAYGGRGEAYLGKGERDQALADLDEAIRLDPTLARAHALRSEASIGE